MTEFTPVTKVVVADKQAAPKIKYEADGHITGHVEYATALIPPGQQVTGELKANGVVVATLGPVMSSALAGKNFIAQMRLKVRDDCGVSEFTKPEPEAP